MLVESTVEVKLEVVEDEDFRPLGRVNGAVMAALMRVLFIVIVLQSEVELIGGVEMTMPWCGLKTMMLSASEKERVSLFDEWRKKEERERRKEEKERKEGKRWKGGKQRVEPRCKMKK